MKYLNFSVVVEEDKNGFFAFCPELQGCYTDGKTHEEAINNIKDAIKLHVQDRVANKETLERPRSVSLATVKVGV